MKINTYRILKTFLESIAAYKISMKIQTFSKKAVVRVCHHYFERNQTAWYLYTFDNNTAKTSKDRFRKNFSIIYRRK